MFRPSQIFQMVDNCGSLLPFSISNHIDLDIPISFAISDNDLFARMRFSNIKFPIIFLNFVFSFA